MWCVCVCVSIYEYINIFANKNLNDNLYKIIHQYYLNYQGMTELPDYKKITFPENPPIPFEELVPDASLHALDLLEKFLVYPSKERIAANEVSRDKFYRILHY